MFTTPSRYMGDGIDTLPLDEGIGYISLSDWMRPYLAG